MQNNFTAFLSKIFNRDFKFDFSDFVQQPEKIDNYYRGYGWFGKLGLTYNFLENNFESFSILVFIIVKLGLVVVFTKAFKTLSKVFIDKKVNFTSLFIMELMCLTPSMVISSL